MYVIVKWMRSDVIGQRKIMDASSYGIRRICLQIIENGFTNEHKLGIEIQLSFNCMFIMLQNFL